jgi:hypothetical protein
MNARRRRPLAGLVVPWLAALALAAGCDRLGIGVTSIADIKKNPAEFEGREVAIRGKVTEPSKIPFLNVTVYQLRDDTGEITVTTSLDLPHAGETVTVRGKVQNVAILAGQSFGVSVSEQERH